jgi:NADH:ubiquinone reductase (H+-translocating)
MSSNALRVAKTTTVARPQTHRVVVVGAGFAGLNAARTLARANREVEITIVDRRNHHLFQPLLYQVAMAGLSPADISAPIRAVLEHHSNIAVRLGHVRAIDLADRMVRCDTGDLPYDHLILACGATHSYFGHEEWEEHAPGLKTLEHATEIRRRVLTAFELAEVEEDTDRRRSLSTFVVVGGGPTGVELAGALGELSRHTLSRDFRRIDPTTTRVVLIEGGPRILPGFAPELSQAAARSLERLGVTIWTDTRVTHVDADGVRAGSERLRAATVLWAAGVRASTLGATLDGARLDQVGRVYVEPDLSLAGHSEVFVVGDLARFEHDGDIVPGLAPAAIQMGKHAARNIVHDLRGASREPFRYLDKGMMATVGRAAAVAQTGGVRLTGFIAWLAWCFVHILYLIDFRNRVIVLVHWVWSYLRYQKGARLITNRDWRAKGVPSTSGRTALPRDEDEKRGPGTATSRGASAPRA